MTPARWRVAYVETAALIFRPCAGADRGVFTLSRLPLPLPFPLPPSASSRCRRVQPCVVHVVLRTTQTIVISTASAAQQEARLMRAPRSPCMARRRRCLRYHASMATTTCHDGALAPEAFELAALGVAAPPFPLAALQLVGHTARRGKSEGR